MYGTVVGARSKTFVRRVYSLNHVQPKRIFAPWVFAAVCKFIAQHRIDVEK